MGLLGAAYLAIIMTAWAKIVKAPTKAAKVYVEVLTPRVLVLTFLSAGALNRRRRKLGNTTHTVLNMSGDTQNDTAADDG